MQIRRLNILIGIILFLSFGMLQAQRVKEPQLSGAVFEKITRPDGEVIYLPQEDVKVYIRDNSEITALTNAEGLFTLPLGNAAKDKERSFKVVAEKNNYKMLLDKNTVKTTAFLSLSQVSQNDLSVDIYLIKIPGIQNNSNHIYKSIGLSGFIQKGDRALEGVEVKVKGIESVHDNTNHDGYFEIYLPESRFNPENTFTILLTKDNLVQEIVYNNLNEFNRDNTLSFQNYVFPKRTTTADRESEESLTDPTNRIADSKRDLQGNKIEKSFRRFINSLDTLNFKNLNTEKIQILKDSLNKYADYLSSLREELTDLKNKTNPDTLVHVEKVLAEKQKELAEKEKELFQAELANKEKTIIILALIIVLIVISSLSYYYFYINKKIKSQSTELNRRHQFIEFLLRELNHRVTNNLQVISSMLKRKIRRLPDENSKNALTEINNRVLDIATVHVGLYSKNDARLTKLSDYLLKITRVLEKLYGFSDKPLKIEVKAPDIEIAHKDAVYFGLIVNELVTNSLKYAFEGITQPKLVIDIQKTKDKTFAIRVEDNGRGIPETFNLAEAKSSGLKLVNLITQMLDGSFKMSSQEGTKFELTLKMK
ncbi:MAG: sensor histidine kinase [Microscillaceae bacterium]|nr:sensor histidine kinase [Microscillaceae bacterium]